MGEKKENKRPIIILPYFMQIHVRDTKTAWESRFYRESAQVPLSSTLLCRRQFTLLLLKHQHNLLCPHLKAPELLGCKKDLQTTEVCVICGGFCHHTASISPEIFKHTMTSHTFISRKPKNGFNDSCFIQLDIILAFSLLIELTFSHIHT